MLLVAILLIAGCSTTTSGTAESPTGLPGTSSAATAGLSAQSPAGPVTASSAVSTVTTTVTATPSPAGTSTSRGPTAPAAPPTDLSGEVYGFVTAVDVAKSQITLDKVDWFTGSAAKQACAADGVTVTDNNWCTGYYYRNVNPALRVVAVSPQATISTLNGSQSVPSDLATVAARVGATAGTSAYHLIVTDGEVTELREIYRP